MTNPDLIALAKRIDATKRRWLPYVSDVVNVTFSLDEADTLSYALRRLASQPSSYEPEAAPAGSVWEALEVIERQLYEMRSLRGWRLNLIRENLGKLHAALALSAPVEAPVAVKPLEWKDKRPTDEIGVTAQDAFSSIGHYIACDNGWFLLGQGDWHPISDIESAKAAAQADYEQRIRSALIATPRQLPSVDEVWQQLLDKDDRTSPEEYPDMCLITFDELKSLLGGSAHGK